MSRSLRYVLPVLVALAAPAGARPPDLSAQRPAILEALRKAAQGTLSLQDRARIADHPLRGWAEAIALRRDLARTRAAEVHAHFRAFPGEPAGDWLREAWLRELARRGDWATFLADHVPTEDPELRCHHLAARLATGGADAAWTDDALALWSRPATLPAACDGPFRALEARGLLTRERRWQRIEAALLAGQTGLARFVARGLPAADSALADDYAAFVDAPHPRADGWPKDARSRSVAAEGLARLARRDPDAAEARLGTLGPRLGLDEALQGKVRYQVALWTVASYLPKSAQRLAAVPASAYDGRLHEWRVREALSRRDDAGALRAIEAMPPAQRRDPRWTYFEARMRERLGQGNVARTLYEHAAGTATFHGFLAADRLQRPYALCPLEPGDDPALRADVAGDPGLARALELFALDRASMAAREWTALLARLSPAGRKVAIAHARDAGWHDRAVLTIGSDPDDLRHYSLRFPLHHEHVIRREARRHALDPAWIAAQTRAESNFMPRARSHADARGLMQLLPSTAQRTARKLGLGWDGPASLYVPETNLVLGIAHLRHELDAHGGVAYKAIAAYNAGPTPVARWELDRPNFEPDLWIETMTYRETRDYVARVLAFSVIYDWRLDGDAVPVSERLFGRTVAKDRRRAFHCPVSPDAATTP